MKSLVRKGIFQMKVACCALFFLYFSLFTLTFSSSSFASEPAWYGSLTGHLIKTSDYQSVAGGAVFTKTLFENSYGLSTAIGYRFSSGFRIEGEIGYDQLEMDQVLVPGFGLVLPSNGWLKRWLGLANIYYDIDTNTPWVPYIGIGAGAAHQNMKGRIPSLGGTKIYDSDTILAYQISTGVNYLVSPKTALFAGYRYLGIDEVELIDFALQDTKIERSDSHHLQLGVRFYF